MTKQEREAKNRVEVPTYYTEEGVSLTKRIDDGLTFVFDTQAEAEKKAKELSSYWYKCEKHSSKETEIAYAVPR